MTVATAATGCGGAAVERARGSGSAVAGAGGVRGGDGRAGVQASAPDRSESEAPLTAVDAIAVLAPYDEARDEADVIRSQTSWLVPGRVQLALGGPFIEGPGGNEPLRVTLFARHGQAARVAVDLPHARFSVWTDRARLLGVMRADTRVTFRAALPQFAADAPHASLSAGAAVRRLGHEGGMVHVRYEGQLEVDGLVPASAVADSGPMHGNRGRRPTGLRSEMVMTGAAIKADMSWGSATLATVARGYLVDVVQDVDAQWMLVAYEDGDVSARGYFQRYAPPASVHYVRPPDVPPPTMVANARVASGTCLYESSGDASGGDAIGYLVGDQPVALDATSAEWWTLAVDTPWGPIAFAARGPTAQTLVACAPAGTVPASKLGAPAPAPISGP